MVRAPCFEWTGLKKGAWSPEEDQKLKVYIKRYGIRNWNEMPKAAGLLRSGKSCRLRWVNYLRPGIKHGNFSKEEEETIIKFHELLGNGWSAIAARLPGRTDNDIKNYWHTRLKKRVKDNRVQGTKLEAEKASYNSESSQSKSSEVNLLLPNAVEASKLEGSIGIPVALQLSTKDFSSTSTDLAVPINKIETIGGIIGSLETFGELQSLQAGSFSVKNSYMVDEPLEYSSQFGSLETIGELQSLRAEPFCEENLNQATFTDPGYIPPTSQICIREHTSPFDSYCDAGTDFWVRLYMQAEMGGKF